MSNNNQNSESSKNGWIKVRFDQMAENIADHIDIPSESGFERFVGGDHLESECLRIKRWGSTNDVDAQKLLFKKGHILFGKRNAYLRKVAYADFDGVCSAHMLVLKSKPEFIEERFFPFFMQTDQFWERADMISEGSMSPTIKWKTLAKQEFMIPPREEQRNISEILWAAEDYIVKNEKLVEETKFYKKILMSELFSKGIGHSEFKNTEIGRIPTEWRVGRLREICEFLDNKRVPIKDSDRSKRKGTYPYYGAQGIIDWIDDYIFDGEYILLAEDGENLVSRKLHIAFKVSGKFWVNNHAHVLKGKTNEIFNDYLIFLLNFIDISPYIVGSAQPKLNQSDTKEIKILLPPLIEQRQIAEILSKVDNTIQKAKENIKMTIALKMKLINQFLNDGLSPTFLDKQQAKQLYETQVSE